jgi:phospholipid transport system substrate-binding protein
MSRFALALILSLIAPFSFAQGVAPDALLRSVTEELIAIIKQDRQIQDGNVRRVANLVETRILPHFDFVRMTQITMGRNWRLATAEQQRTLTGEFKTLLVRTYSSALSSYHHQLIEYKPLHAPSNATEVTVKTSVGRSGSERTTIDYDMANSPAGWKVYDIKIDGVSLVMTYRSAFDEKVRDFGIDGLIKSLSDKNRQTSSSEKPKNTNG